MLFIDEAYTLINDPEDSFGREALDTLLKIMHDHMDRLAVILSGYSDGRLTTLLDSNPGIKNRIGAIIHFEDYTPIELYEIFQLQALQNSVQFSPTFEEAIKNVILKFIYKWKARFW